MQGLEAGTGVSVRALIISRRPFEKEGTSVKKATL